MTIGGFSFSKVVALDCNFAGNGFHHGAFSGIYQNLKQLIFQALSDGC